MVEAVPNAPDIDDVVRMTRCRLDLLSQICNVRVDDPVGDKGVGTPDQVQELISAEHFPPIPNQSRKQLELDRRQIDWNTCSAHLKLLKMHFAVTKPEYINGLVLTAT